MDQNCFFLLFIAIPFICLTVMYVVLTLVNKTTTGEIKFILPPDMLLKIFAIFLLISVIFVLALNKIISDSTVGTLLGAIIAGTLGIFLQAKKSGE